MDTVCGQGWDWQCDCVAESSDGFMFLKVCSCLDLDTCFASSLVQDGEIIAPLQKPDLENFFLVSIPIDVASRTFFQNRRSYGYCEGVDSLVQTSNFSVASRNLS